jgi:hypothetical protein
MALELSSSIPTWINGVPCIPVENVNITKGRPTKRRKGGFGYIGKQLFKRLLLKVNSKTANWIALLFWLPTLHRKSF